MSSETEKMLSSALKVFNTKLCERQVIKLEGMEDYVKVPQYKALVNLEKKASQQEVDTVLRIQNSKMAYLKAVQELRACEKRYFEEIQRGIESLEDRNRLVKDVNMRMRKGDYSVLQPAALAAAAAAAADSPASSPRPARNTAAKPPMPRRAEAARPAPAAAATSKTAKPELTDIKKRLAMINMDTTPRSPLQPIHANNKTAKITTTPKAGPTLSSKGSLDGSLVPNRAPTTPLSHQTWNVPAPNFDDTLDAEPINPLLRGAPTHHRPLPTALLQSPDEREEAEDTFPLNQPSLPFQTPTVPHSRPFLLSSMRKNAEAAAAKQDEAAPTRPMPTPVSTRPAPTPRSARPIPTPVSVARPSTAPSADPLNNLGLMKLKRPVLNSEVGKKLMGQL